MRANRFHIEFRRHAELRPPTRHAELRAVSIDDDGAIACVWSQADEDYIVAFDQSCDDAITVKAPRPDIDAIAVLPDVGFVLSSRRQRAPTSSFAYDPDGHMTASGTLGDAVEHVLATPSGKLWVGYFDEGALSGSEPACHGLVRFGPDLDAEWLFPQAGGHGHIWDCYALNCAGETATAYAYDDFDIVQVRDDHIRRWTGSPSGAHGVMIAGGNAVLIGGYGADENRAAHVALGGDGCVERLGDGSVTGLPEQSGPYAPTRICRGPDMHVITGSQWHRASMP